MHLKTYALGWSLEVHYRKCNNKCHSINTYPYSQMKLFILFGNALGNSFFCFFVAWIRNRTETHLVIFLFLGIDLEQKQKTKNKLFFLFSGTTQETSFLFLFSSFPFSSVLLPLSWSPASVMAGNQPNEPSELARPSPAPGEVAPSLPAANEAPRASLWLGEVKGKVDLAIAEGGQALPMAKWGLASLDLGKVEPRLAKARLRLNLTRPPWDWRHLGGRCRPCSGQPSQGSRATPTSWWPSKAWGDLAN